MNEEEKTVLHVRPIDMSAQGSYKLRRRFLEMPVKLAELQRAGELAKKEAEAFEAQAEKARADGDESAAQEAETKAWESLTESNMHGAEAMRVMLDMEDFVIDRCYTDNGAPMEEIIDDLSADEFDALYQALGESPVPQPSAES